MCSQWRIEIIPPFCAESRRKYSAFFVKPFSRHVKRLTSLTRKRGGWAARRLGSRCVILLHRCPTLSTTHHDGLCPISSTMATQEPCGSFAVGLLGKCVCMETFPFPPKSLIEPSRDLDALLRSDDRISTNGKALDISQD